MNGYATIEFLQVLSSPCFTTHGRGRVFSVFSGTSHRRVTPIELLLSVLVQQTFHPHYILHLRNQDMLQNKLQFWTHVIKLSVLRLTGRWWQLMRMGSEQFCILEGGDLLLQARWILVQAAGGSGLWGWSLVLARSKQWILIELALLVRFFLSFTLRLFVLSVVASDELRHSLVILNSSHCQISKISICSHRANLIATVLKDSHWLKNPFLPSEPDPTNSTVVISVSRLDAKSWFSVSKRIPASCKRCEQRKFSNVADEADNIAKYV